MRTIAEIIENIAAKQPREAAQRYCAITARRRYDELIGNADVPLRHLRQTVSPNSPPQWRAAMNSIRALLGTGAIFIIHGGRGCGKTQLAVEAIKLNAAAGRSARYCTAIQFLADIKSTYRHDAAADDLAVLRRYRRPGLLVIDEADKRSETAWENNLLAELIDQRYRDLTDTIIVANYDAAQVVAALPASICSRAVETGGRIDCTGWPTFRSK